MSKLISRRVAATIMCLSSVMAHAQSYYNDEWCDAYDPSQSDCTAVYTEVVGDTLASGCGRQAVINSTLNGNYASTSSIFPSTATLTQLIAGAKSGVDYTWNLTEEFFYTNPYGKGGCVMGAVSWPWKVSIRTTNYKWTGFFTSIGWCEYDQWCASTETATCGPGMDVPQSVEPDYSFGATGCATWYWDETLALKDAAGTYCLGVGDGSMAYVPNACT
jgi:hypothetical protein